MKYFIFAKVLFINLQVISLPSKYSPGTNRFKCVMLIVKNITNGLGSGCACLCKLSCISSSVVCAQLCFNSNVFTVRNGPVGWAGEKKVRSSWRPTYHLVLWGPTRYNVS